MQKHNQDRRQENSDHRSNEVLLRWMNPQNVGKDLFEQDRLNDGLLPDTHGHWAWRRAGRPRWVKGCAERGKI